MTDSRDRIPLPLCPSARPDMPGSVVFGVVGEGCGSLLGYTKQLVPVTPEVLALTGPVEPTEVFRFAASCAGDRCRHFDGSDCRLATRIVRTLPAVVDALPACRLRPSCRWWHQEGRDACIRCPQIVSEVCAPSDLLRQVADPDTPTD